MLVSVSEFEEKSIFLGGMLDWLEEHFGSVQRFADENIAHESKAEFIDFAMSPHGRLPMYMILQHDGRNEYEKLAMISRKMKRNRGLLNMVVGSKGCLPTNTLVQTPDKHGIRHIQEAKEVLSYNFKKKRIEPKPAIPHFVGKKQIITIHTQKGIISCSPEHMWFVKNNNNIILKEAKDLNNLDSLILL